MVWPVTLPVAPLEAGFADSSSSSLLSASVDTGLPKRRRKYTKGYRVFTVSFHVTAAQADILSAFWYDDCGEGTIPFYWDDPRTGIVRSVSFDTAPEFVANGPEYLVKVSFSALEGQI